MRPGRIYIKPEVRASDLSKAKLDMFLWENYDGKHRIGEYLADGEKRLIVYTDAHDWAAFILKKGHLFEEFKQTCHRWDNRFEGGYALGELKVMFAGMGTGKSYIMDNVPYIDRED